MSDDNPTPDDIIHELAEIDLAFQARVEAGGVPPAERKAYEAHRAALIAQLDDIRGTTDVTYEQFRSALDQGEDCQRLFDLRNGMHPKDPLKQAATEDLRGVGCYSPRSIRRTDS